MSENVEAKKPEVSECDTASEASYAPSTSSHKPSGIRPPSVRIGRICTATHATPKASHPPVTPMSESKSKYKRTPHKKLLMTTKASEH